MSTEVHVRILLLAASMGIGGAETHILELARALVLRGHSVTVASDGGILTERLISLGAKHTEVPLASPSPTAVLRSYEVLSGMLRHRHFDMIHAHSGISALVGSALGRRFGIPAVTTFHGICNSARLLRMLTDRGRYSLAVSEDIRRYMSEHCRIPREHIGLTVNGIDTDRFERHVPALPRDIPDMSGSRCILCISRLEKDTSWHVLRMLEAIPQIVSAVPTAKLLVAGDGSMLGRIARLAAEINRSLGRICVFILGSRTDTEAVLSLADVFVGVSRAAMEAMACRVPTILSGAQGHLGIFTPELESIAAETNFCCRGNAVADSSVLADEVCDLLSRPEEELLKMGNLNRSVIKRLYSVGQMADDAERLYRYVSDGARRRGGCR